MITLSFPMAGGDADFWVRLQALEENKSGYFLDRSFKPVYLKVKRVLQPIDLGGNGQLKGSSTANSTIILILREENIVLAPKPVVSDS